MAVNFQLDPAHDHIIPLPPHWQYLNQFKPSSWAPQPSEYRCVAAAAVMAAQVAYPSAFNPEQAEHLFYQKYAGPDVVSNTNGIGKESLLSWFRDNKIGYIDLQEIVDSGDDELLREEITAQNKQGVLQIIGVADESTLTFATTGQKLHAWNDKGLAHVFVRLGYSDNRGFGLYAEPAAAGFSYDDKGNWRPVPIMWNAIVAGKITNCVSVMPSGVHTPPAGFRYYRGANQPDNRWPEPPKPPVDAAALSKALTDYKAKADQIKQESDDLFLRLISLLSRP